jgi:hypothetical protein
MPTLTPNKTVGPPDDYWWGRHWCDDPQDVFYVEPELRPAYCSLDAPPTKENLRKLYDGGVQLHRVLRDAKGRCRPAPDIQNTGALAMVRPLSVDMVTVDFDDDLHVAAWRHALRLRFAENQVRAEQQSQAMEAGRPRCQICNATLFSSSAPIYRPWSKGKGRLCALCSEAVNLAGAQQHLDAHRAAVTSLLESLEH